MMNMSKPEKSVTKDMLMGMKVVDGQGNAIGTVKDVSFVVGKMGLSLYVEAKKGGDTRNVSWEEVQAVGDFVLLKPPQAQMPQPQAAAHVCPTCGGPLRYIEQYKRWWCDRERKYV
jgi:sporulation protein YlmC with PRC-barrel domain